MSKNQSNNSDNLLFSFLGGLIVILLFLAVVYFGYLPQKHDPINEKVDQARIAKANETVAKGEAKIKGYKVLDSENNIFQIPIEKASVIALNKYRSE